MRTSLVGTLANGDSVFLSVGNFAPPISVWVNPTPGDTIRVEYRCDPLDDWTPWPKGDVTTRTDDVLDGPVSDLRFTRVSGSGTTSKFGVL